MAPLFITKCPNCGKPLSKNKDHLFCMYCGYLDNGNFIENMPKKNISDLEIYLGEEYDKMLRNTTYLQTFLLGPLYFCYRGYFLLGFILFPIEIYLSLFLSRFYNHTIGFIILLLISRIFYMTIANSICLSLKKREIIKIKKKFPLNYLEKLQKKANYQKRYFYVFLAIFLYFLIIFIILLPKWIENGLI